MKITNNYTKTYSPQFGNVIATDKAIAYMNKTMNPKKIAKVNKIIAEQNGKKPNIHISLGSFIRAGSNTRMPYLRANVNDEVFKEGLFTSSYGVVKNAAKYVDSLIAKSKKV